MVADPTKFSTKKVAKLGVGQNLRPTWMPTPNWQPNRAALLSRMFSTTSPLSVVVAPAMTTIPNSCSAQLPLPGNGPATVRPLIVTATPEPQITTIACGSNRPGLAKAGGSGAEGAAGNGFGD